MPPAASLTAQNELQNALPGALKRDRMLIERAVTDLNDIHRTRGVEYARQVGGYVLSRFFRNKAGFFRAHGDTHVSYRALAEQAGLEMSYSTLHKCVGVELQIREMPLELAMALSYTHHVHLLGVKHPQDKLELARLAQREALTSREFSRAIRRRRVTRPVASAGRPPLPAFVKGLRRVGRGVDEAFEEEISRQAVERYGSDRVMELLRHLDEQVERLTALRAELALRVSPGGMVDRGLGSSDGERSGWSA